MPLPREGRCPCVPGWAPPWRRGTAKTSTYRNHSARSSRICQKPWKQRTQRFTGIYVQQAQEADEQNIGPNRAIRVSYARIRIQEVTTAANTCQTTEPGNRRQTNQGYDRVGHNQSWIAITTRGPTNKPTTNQAMHASCVVNVEQRVRGGRATHHKLVTCVSQQMYIKKRQL